MYHEREFGDRGGEPKRRRREDKTEYSRIKEVGRGSEGGDYDRSTV